MKKHVPHTGKWGNGDRHIMKIVKEIITGANKVNDERTGRLIEIVKLAMEIKS